VWKLRGYQKPHPEQRWRFSKDGPEANDRSLFFFPAEGQFEAACGAAEQSADSVSVFHVKQAEALDEI
jgi:hypothetical protein